MRKTLAAITLSIPLLLTCQQKASSFLEISVSTANFGKYIFYEKAKCHTCHSMGNPDSPKKDNLIEKIKISFNASYPVTNRYGDQYSNFGSYIFSYICRPDAFNGNTIMPIYNNILSVEEISAVEEYIIYEALEENLMAQKLSKEVK